MVTRLRKDGTLKGVRANIKFDKGWESFKVLGYLIRTRKKDNLNYEVFVLSVVEEGRDINFEIELTGKALRSMISRFDEV